MFRMKNTEDDAIDSRTNTSKTFLRHIKNSHYSILGYQIYIEFDLKL